MLLVPAAAQFFEPFEPLLARLVVGVEPPAVYPDVAACGTGLDADDLVCCLREQFAVVGDEQPGLLGLAQALL